MYNNKKFKYLYSWPVRSPERDECTWFFNCVTDDLWSLPTLQHAVSNFIRRIRRHRRCILRFFGRNQQQYDLWLGQAVFRILQTHHRCQVSNLFSLTPVPSKATKGRLVLALVVRDVPFLTIDSLLILFTTCSQKLLLLGIRVPKCPSHRPSGKFVVQGVLDLLGTVWKQPVFSPGCSFLT